VRAAGTAVTRKKSAPVLLGDGCFSQRVNASRFARYRIACVGPSPHISADGFSPPHTAGRSGDPKIRHRFASSSWTHRTPAGLPLGMPGIAELMEGAMQQAPQPGRQFMHY
jgi:hypothetical protein